jgi:glycosyltransferase involved in cell wall biosynthesis
LRGDDGAKVRRENCVLTVSRVDRRKNHVRMLRVFERLVAAGLVERWIVAGPDGHGVEEFDAALALSPVRARVERLRHVSDAQLPRLYRSARLFLFASLDEGFGLPPLEALACGAPVVAGRNSSMPEVLGDAALLVDAEDDDAIFAASRELLTQSDLAAELRERGLSRARTLSWKACARAVHDVYRLAAAR